MVGTLALLIQLFAIFFLIIFVWKMVQQKPTPQENKSIILSRKRAFSIGLFRNLQLTQTMRKLLAFGAVLLSNLLYASFAPVAKASLDRLDPILFTALEMVLLVPYALFLLIRWRQLLTQQILLRGLLLGTCLAVALLLLTWSLASTSILETVFFQSLNGLVATAIAFFILRQQLSSKSKMACLCLLIGVSLIWLTSFTHWQGNFAAFVGGSFLIIFLFLVERLLPPVIQQYPKSLWPFLGIQFFALAGTCLLVALCFSDWRGIQILQREDMLVLGYTSIGTLLIPLILTTKAQQYVSAVTVAYLALVEPISVAFFAWLLGERLELLSYAGGGLICLGIILQTVAGAKSPVFPPLTQEADAVPLPPPDAPKRSMTYRIPLGRRALILMALLASAPQGVSLSTLQHWTGAPRSALHSQLVLLRRHGYVMQLNVPNHCYMHSYPYWRVCLFMTEENQELTMRIH